MPNKIHQQLKQLAKEILEMEEPYKYQKVYDATFLPVSYTHLTLPTTPYV